MSPVFIYNPSTTINLRVTRALRGFFRERYGFSLYQLSLNKQSSKFFFYIGKIFLKGMASFSNKLLLKFKLSIFYVTKVEMPHCSTFVFYFIYFVIISKLLTSTHDLRGLVLQQIITNPFELYE